MKKALIGMLIVAPGGFFILVPFLIILGGIALISSLKQPSHLKQRRAATVA